MTKPTTKIIPIFRIKFPEIKLQTRDAHKMRGYIGNLFKKHSPVLHNQNILNYSSRSNANKDYEGAELLPKLFLK